MKVTYHKSHSFKIEEQEINCVTQLYQVGVYVIVNNNSSQQFNMSPQEIAQLEKKLKKDEKAKNIKDLEFGIPITVTDESGLWEEVK